jgi:hypothetical protein
MNMISTNAKELDIKLTQDINIPAKKPYALSINMGGDGVSVVAIVYRKNWDCVNSDRIQKRNIVFNELTFGDSALSPQY